MDRCALFVDAGYMLADGAMAVHGTRRRESVSWDYEGLLQLLGNLARDRTGLPLLRCYWYEATVEGRRTAEHDALADMPGIKLRLAKLRPGRREGVETEIHRDLTVLARNRAVSDAVVISAEEDLAQVLSDVQDLGMRVTIVHVTVDGNWTISRSLRQECDDIMELTSTHLRPYIELIPGAEPARADEQYAAGALSLRSASNGHSNGSTGSHQALPPGTGHAGPPSIYTAPVVAEYQRPAPPLTPQHRDQPEPEPPVRERPVPPPLVFGRPETAGAPGTPERGEPAHPESSRPEPVRGGAPRGDMLRGDMPPAGSRGDFDRAGFDAPDAGQRGRPDRAGPNAAGASRVRPRCPPRRRTATQGRRRPLRGRTCMARRSPCLSGAPRKGSRCRMTCPAAMTRAAVAVRSRPVTRKPTGRSRRRVSVALRARPAPQAGGVRRPVSTPAASGAPRNLPGTARAARSRSAGKRSTSIAGESPHPARSAAPAARRRDRPGPARRARSRGLTPTGLPLRRGRTLPRSLRARRVRRHRARPRRACPAHRARSPSSRRRTAPTAGPSRPVRPDGRRLRSR